MQSNESEIIDKPSSMSIETDEAQAIVHDLQSSFRESEKYEKDVRTRLATQILKTNDLNDRLEKEKNRSDRLLYAMTDDVLCTSESTVSSERHNIASSNGFQDLRSTFGTISPVLMQYRFITIHFSEHPIRCHCFSYI